MTERYIHRWPLPIVVIVHGVAEHWYREPWYDPRLLPVPVPEAQTKANTKGEGQCATVA